MSQDGGRRRGAYTPKAAEAGPVVGHAGPLVNAATVASSPPAAKIVPPATCGECKHWRDKLADETVRLNGDPDPSRFGLCVVDPPSVPHKPTAIGLSHSYRVTTADEFACGKCEAK